MKLEDIIRPISGDIDDFNRKFKETISLEGFFVDDISSHIFNSTGKKIRPIISFLSAKLMGEINQMTIRATIILELLHTASLVHDDVLDQSEKRRGEKSVNWIWGNNSAILYGDFLYSKCLELIETKEDFSLMPLYARIGKELPLGELLQKEVSLNADYSLESYFKVIEKKTATLMEASALVGALTNNQEGEKKEAIKEFGKMLGIAFQIKDDILDFSQKDIGKPMGNDIREKKITLPLIYLLEELDNNDKQDMLNELAKEDKREEDILRIIDMIRLGGYLDKANSKVEQYSQKAKQALSIFEDSIYKNSLIKLVDYLLKRHV